MLIRPRLRAPASTMRGLQGWWTFDKLGFLTTINVAMPLVLDRSGNSKHGMIAAAAGTPPIFFPGIVKSGPNNLALKWNNSNNQEVNVGNIDFSAKTITVAAWVYPTQQTAATFYIIAAKREIGVCWQFYTVAGDLRWFLGSTEVSSSTTLALNQWQHVAVTFSDAADTAQFYVNGLKVADVAATDAATADAGAVVFASRSPASGASGWFGALDDCRIYNRVLSPAEVRSIWAEAYQPAYEIETIALMQPAPPVPVTLFAQACL